MAEPEQDLPRSLNSNTPVYVSFCNRTLRSVFLFWIDWSGHLVRYGHIPPRRGTSINTYVTHPWVASDAVTGSPLHLEGEVIFYPQESENRTVVSIDIPVYTLKRICTELVFKLYTRTDISQLDIPVHLKRILERVSPMKNFNDYPEFSSIRYRNLATFGVIEDSDDDHNHAQEGL